MNLFIKLKEKLKINKIYIYLYIYININNLFTINIKKFFSSDCSKNFLNVNKFFQ